jgi:hypothetical protein
MSHTLRFRQVHLDFHTSEQIAGIGTRFDAEKFADTLSRAHVDSVTCFGRCHHGWLYYDTDQFAERRHPHLALNLLKDQIEACHARDIRVPIYLTVQWDEYTAERYPEWLHVDADGRIAGTKPYDAGFYRRLLVNSPYMDFLKASVKDLFDCVPVDGLFFDIVQPLDDSSIHSRRQMIDQGLDPSDENQRKAFGQTVMETFRSDMSAFVRDLNPEATIFYNSGHIGPQHRSTSQTYSHFELESLPSGGWGYVHFPMAVRYARTLGLDCMGMTGKFHTSWGDFHSFKNPEALQYECFQMLAHGAKCSVGDQLHPEGEICKTTYDLIGSVYSEVEKKEPWCVDATPLVDIAVMTTEEFSGERIPLPMSGAVHLLQEGAHQFDIIDSDADLSAYALVILPDDIPVDTDLRDRLNDFVEGGGSLIASHRSGLKTDGSGFALDGLGVDLIGEAPYSPDFVQPKGLVGKGLPETGHVIYMKAMEVAAQSGSDTLAVTLVPYFNRTWEHFCSHKHTPSAEKPEYPAIVKHGHTIYFAHPVFSQYGQNAPRWVKQLVLNAIDILLPNPVIRIDGPSTILSTVNEQPGNNRCVVHLLHYIPERRGADFDVIEDVIPIFDVGVSVRCDRGPEKVQCVPDGDEIEFAYRDGRVSFVVPKVEGHQMVEIG